MEFLNKDKIEKMSFGVFNNRSYNGFKGSVIKSGICKYTRRAVFDKLEYCIVEMAIFGIKSKPLFTNLLNRLKILIMEEFVVSNGNLLIELIDKINKVEESDNFDDKIKYLLHFVSIFSKCKRGRICSYYNNFYRFNTIEYNFDEVKLDKVLKYKKKKDTDELLKLGEILIDYIDNKNENIADIFNKLYSLEGKFSSRNRRTSSIGLFWEIVFDKFKDNSNFTKIIKFSQDMFHKKLKESPYYGIWICLFIINYDKINWDEDIDINYENVDLKDYFEAREKVEFEFDNYVILDYHVNKTKNSLAKFAQQGAYVLDENLDDLGDYGLIMKEFYIQKKLEMDEENKNKPKKEKKISKKRVKKEKLDDLEKDLQFLDFDENFSDITIIDQGVCTSKLPVIKCKYKNQTIVLKEFTKSLNYGRDYILVDKCKEMFGLIDLKMVRIKSNKGILRIDDSKKNYKDNSKIGDKECVYCMMKHYENKEDLGRNKNLFKDKNVRMEALKIRLFDGCFRSSDNISRNILVGVNNELISIDEGDLYNKRKNIFNKKGDLSIKNMNMDELNLVLDDILNNKEEKEEKIIELLKEYNFHNKIEEFKNRFNDYRNIVINELNTLLNQ
jgi:hypothetical protein